MRCPNCATTLQTHIDEENLTQKMEGSRPFGVRWQCPLCGFETAANHLKIDAIWAFLSVDNDTGNEGVITMRSVNGLMPMVAADEERLESMRPIAAMVAKNSGIKVRLVKFSVREDLEVFDGDE